MILFADCHGAWATRVNADMLMLEISLMHALLTGNYLAR